jgi:hypothetical protein
VIVRHAALAGDETTATKMDSAIAHAHVQGRSVIPGE